MFTISVKCYNIKVRVGVSNITRLLTVAICSWGGGGGGGEKLSGSIGGVFYCACASVCLLNRL